MLVVSSKRLSARSPSMTSPQHGEPVQPFCGALSSTSAPEASMSTQTAPDAMQSNTNIPPTACTASATCRT